MSDPTDPPSGADEPTAAATEPPAAPPRRHRALVIAVIVVVLVGAGVGVGVAVTGGGKANTSSPTAAVNKLLDAADKSDLLGALDAIVPGERDAIKPGLLDLVQELQRLNVLTSDIDLNHIGALSLKFSGIETRTETLRPDVVAVFITRGSSKSSVNSSELPLGSFVTALARGVLQKKSENETGSASTGRSAIVTEDVGGTWYVSLGYTIAVDNLRTSGGSGAPPPVSEQVQPSGAATPGAAVQALLDDGAALNLRGLISDVPPGELGALQAYAARFLGTANANLAKTRSAVGIRITSLKTTTSAIDGGTLVLVHDLGLSANFSGVTLTLGGGCVSITGAGQSSHECSSSSTTSAQLQKLLAALPTNLRALATRLTTHRPAIGFVTVEDGGRWYVSPTATVLHAVDAYAAVLEPQDLVTIAGLAADPAKAKALGQSLEQIALGGLTG